MVFGDGGAFIFHFCQSLDVIAYELTHGVTFHTDNLTVALRSLRAPGTAYNDPRVGKDSQGPTMDEFHRGMNGRGGVHINSGIPNHAFFLAAMKFGGHSWEKAGPIWYATLTGKRIPQDCDFKTFANATCENAQKLYGADAQAIVKGAWENVKVL
ncbi:Translation initiation factor 3 subunit b [Podila horticola]|nr:Translation initiation factor 3 subunit b [Podila horticola]